MKRPKQAMKVALIGTILLLATTAAYANSPIRIVLNGEPLSTDVAPKMENGRVLVPISTIARAFGAAVHWNDQTKTVEIQTAENVWDDQLANIPWQHIHDLIMQYIVGFDSRNEELVAPLRSQNFDSDVIGPEVVVPFGGIYPAVIDTQFVDAKQDENFDITVRVAIIKQENGLIKQTLDFVLEPANTSSTYGYFIKGIWRVEEKELNEYSPFPGITFRADVE